MPKQNGQYPPAAEVQAKGEGINGISGRIGVAAHMALLAGGRGESQHVPVNQGQIGHFMVARGKEEGERQKDTVKE